MAEHWCKEHKQPFFKKGKMPGFAHPILDEEGEPTKAWCNEPKPSEESIDKSKESPERQASIEIQNAYTGIPALVEAMAKYPNNQLLDTAANYVMSKLGNWASMPYRPVAKVEPEPKQATQEATMNEIPQTIPELMKWVIGHGKTYTPSWACEALGIKAPTEITDIEKAYKDLKSKAGW